MLTITINKSGLTLNVYNNIFNYDNLHKITPIGIRLTISCGFWCLLFVEKKLLSARKKLLLSRFNSKEIFYSPASTPKTH